MAVPYKLVVSDSTSQTSANASWNGITIQNLDSVYTIDISSNLNFPPESTFTLEPGSPYYSTDSSYPLFLRVTPGQTNYSNANQPISVDVWIIPGGDPSSGAALTIAPKTLTYLGNIPANQLSGEFFFSEYANAIVLTGVTEGISSLDSSLNQANLLAAVDVIATSSIIQEYGLAVKATSTDSQLTGPFGTSWENGAVVAGHEFTAECFFTPGSNSAYPANMYLMGRGDGQWFVGSQANTNTLLVGWKNGSGTDVFFVSPTALVAGTRYHIALTWDGANIRFFINGTETVGGAMATVYPAASNGALFILGGVQVAGNIIDEVRISNVAYYTANFNPPTAPFIENGNTGCLYHFDGYTPSITVTSGPSNTPLNVGETNDQWVAVLPGAPNDTNVTVTTDTFQANPIYVWQTVAPINIQNTYSPKTVTYLTINGATGEDWEVILPFNCRIKCISGEFKAIGGSTDRISILSARVPGSYYNNFAVSLTDSPITPGTALEFNAYPNTNPFSVTNSSTGTVYSTVPIPDMFLPAGTIVGSTTDYLESTDLYTEVTLTLSTE